MEDHLPDKHPIEPGSDTPPARGMSVSGGFWFDLQHKGSSGLGAEVDGSSGLPGYMGIKFIGWFLLGIAMSAVFVIGYGAIFPGQYSANDGQAVGLLIVSMLGMWTGFVGGPLYYSRRYLTGSLWRDFGGDGFLWKDILIGIGGGFGAQIASVVVMLPFLLTSPDLRDRQDEAVRQLLPGSGLGKFVILFLVVVATPIVEELFFRGLVWLHLERKYRVGVAIAMNGLFFGAVHVLNQPIGVPALIVVGMVFAALRGGTGRIAPAVIAHMTFNGITALGHLAAMSLPLMLLPR